MKTKFKFEKKRKVEEGKVVVLMANEGCTNSVCTGTNVGTCTTNNNVSGCGR